jgi:predicted NBD/HSP70 family sugar kinase
METVAIRELSGDLIAGATAQGQVLGITNKGALVGVLVPLTGEVVQRMANRDAADIRENARQADADLASAQPMRLLSDLLQGGGPAGHRAGPARVSIRELSGARLEEAARDGRALLVSSGRVTLALLIPITPSWLERLVEGAISQFIDGDSPDSGGRLGEVVGVSPQSAIFPSAVPTATSAVGMVTPKGEVPPPQASLGREILLQRAIGIRIIADPADGQSRLQGVVTDMLAHEEGRRLERGLENMDEGHVFAAILSLIDDLRAYIAPEERLIGVGLEIGGHVHDGRIIYSANANWGDFPLADRLNAVLGLPVVLENDGDALAILERRFDGVPEDNLAVILLTYVGIGCGLVIDGHVFRGTTGMAGEIGHIPLASGNGDSLGCRCGNHDCLECAATPRAIDEALKESGFKGGYRAALQAVTSRDDVRQRFEVAGAALGRGAATVINLLNPSAIVFYGPPELLGASREFRIGTDPRSEANAHPYAAAMVEAIRNNSFSTGASDCRFIIRKSIDDHSARAAAACLINRILPTSQLLRSRPVMVHAGQVDNASGVTMRTLGLGPSAGLQMESAGGSAT